MEILLPALKESLNLTLFVFITMMLVEYLNVISNGRLTQIVKGKGFRQYLVVAVLGVMPGCLGAFLNVSLYVHGIISFGAICGGMIATSGDEAFVMLRLFPDKALLLFFLLFALGVSYAFLTDQIARLLKFKTCESCPLDQVHPVEVESIHSKDIIANFKNISQVRFLLLVLFLILLYGFISGWLGGGWDWEKGSFVFLLFLAVIIAGTATDHYLKEHLWEHLARKHLWKILLWTFGALLLVDLGLKFQNLEELVKSYPYLVFLIAALVGIIPESGPHLIFVMMFAKGLLPFSVLLTSSIVQDGHGMLPLLSYSVKDAVLIKLFNFIFGLAIGLIFYRLGF